MNLNESNMFMSKAGSRIRPADEDDHVYFELLIRSDYERCHPEGTWEDLKRRARFSKEDKGLLRDWMALARDRAAARGHEKPSIDLGIAA